MNATRETVEPAMRAAAEDICGGEYTEVVPVDTRNLMGFYVCLRRLLVEVCLRSMGRLERGNIGTDREDSAGSWISRSMIY